MKMNEREKAKRLRKSKWKVRIFVIELILIITLGCFVLDMFKKKNQFPEETIINGLDCSKLTIDDATQLLKLKQNEEFIIILKNNDIVSLKAHDFDYCLNDIEPKLEEMKDKAWNSKAQKREYQC